MLGHIDWHDSVRRTRFLDFVNTAGPQFGYPLIDNPGRVSFNFFYGSNLSIDRDLLLREPFDETFVDAAWEDIELGYRLCEAGLRIVYEPDAGALHRHPTDLRSFLARQERVGAAAAVLFRLHPELGEFLGLRRGEPLPAPHPAGLTLARALARVLESAPLELPRTWGYLCNAYYVRGLRRAVAAAERASRQGG